MDNQATYIEATKATLKQIQEHCRGILTDWARDDEFTLYVDWFLFLSKTL